MKITKDTQLITSFAAKQNSLGAAMHNAGYTALKVNFVYIPISTDDIKNAIAGVRGFNLRGNTVSMPHKQTVIQYLDKIDPVAERIGAVNTVLNDDGCLTGYNSDWLGAMGALKEVIDLEGKTVIVIGAGGVARAIVYGLLNESANVIVYNRTVEKAQNLATDFGIQCGGDLAALKFAPRHDVVINATSIGSSASNFSESAVEDNFFHDGVVAMDVIIVPTETKFLSQAKSRGAIQVHGYRMLMYQAVFQMELFTGRKAPLVAMERALLDGIGEQP